MLPMARSGLLPKLGVIHLFHTGVVNLHTGVITTDNQGNVSSAGAIIADNQGYISSAGAISTDNQGAR